jgi:hypothetical protein
MDHRPKIALLDLAKLEPSSLACNAPIRLPGA